MARDRARDDRRSVGSHEKMMGALGRAAGWRSVEAPVGQKLPRTAVKKWTDEGSNAPFTPGEGHVKSGMRNNRLDLYDGVQGILKNG